MPQETKSRYAIETVRYNFDESGSAADAALEPTLDEILSDPIVHLVLGRDHLEISEVERFLRSASKRLIECDRSPNFGRVTRQQDCNVAGL